jgi:diguanylate cyclase (GGDEF)-like protein/PAS domain S-box-containing protein
MPTSPPGYDSTPDYPQPTVFAFSASAVLEQVGEGVAVVSNEAFCQYANRAFADMHGYTAEQLRSTHFRALYSPDEWNGPVQTLMHDTLAFGVGRADVVRQRLDGSQFDAHVTLSLLKSPSGEVTGRVMCVQDVTVRKQLERQLHRAALRDPLTDLPNRRLLLDRLDHALVVSERDRTAVAVLFIDLDGFKAVNDAHGHAIGDELLVRCGGRFGGCLRSSDTLARLGGDEFVVILEALCDQQQAVDVARTLLTALDRPVKLNMVTARIAASIGIAIGTGTNARALVHAADNAMYRAKTSGGGQLCVSAAGGTRH